MAIKLTGKTLTCDEVYRVARHGEKVELSQEAVERINEGRKVVQHYIDESKVAYGVTTGVGKLMNTIIPAADAAELQKNLSVSHACGVGTPLSVEEARAIMVIRANIFCLGHSGIRLSTVEFLLGMLNAGITPLLPKKGGVGSSGSLSIGAHLAMAMRGENEVMLGGKKQPSRQALESKGLTPVVFEAKECLSMINGTHAMCGVGVLALGDLRIAIKSAEIAAALSLEALEGNTAAFDPRLNSAKNHPGQKAAAENMLHMIEGSELFTLKKRNVQDAYSLRCLPQVHGAARDLLDFVAMMLEREINAAADNPLVFVEENEILSGGNFHGQPAAIALDNLAMACATVAKISERRISRLTDPQSSGLPAFLVEGSGLNSGMMIPQYVAANLAAEIKLAAIPASIDTIPTSGGQEDVISNGTIAANQAREAVDNMQIIVGIELMCAAQAIELSGRKNLGKGAQAAYQAIRQAVTKLEGDRFMEPDIMKATELVTSGSLVRDTEAKAGALN